VWNLWFCIVIGGCVPTEHPTATNLLAGAARPIQLPTLHIRGSKDAIVPASSLLQLVTHFVDPKVAKHDGGHSVPGDAESKAALLLFCGAVASGKLHVVGGVLTRWVSQAMGYTRSMFLKICLARDPYFRCSRRNCTAKGQKGSKMAQAH
jgi:hypothetical protein